MGLFGRGDKRPAGPPRSPDEVRDALLAVNRSTAPFVVRDGSPEGVDLVAEWRIVDATWYQIFAKAGLSKVFRVLMRLDAGGCEVRAVDEEWEVQWQAGVPVLSMSKETFRGQKASVQFGQGYAFTERGQYGEVYNYRFRTGELKDPLKEAVKACGWKWNGVAFGKL
jgi:hypothetical protein